jgi:hypothetical protein
MDWIVDISDEERARGTPSPRTRDAAHAALQEHGCVLLRGLFMPDKIDALHREFRAQYGACDAPDMAALAARDGPNPILEVGPARYEITLHIEGAFADPVLFANPLLLGLALPLLGGDMRLSGMTAVVSYPGAALQHVHRDHALLFGEAGLGSNLPIYALNAALPLIDIDLETGPTGVWLGSHRWPAEAPMPGIETVTQVPLQRGDGLLLDYRVLHTGLPNRGTGARPILYMVYARSWFYDEINHTNRPSLDMSPETFAALSPPHQQLLLRAHMQNMRTAYFRARNALTLIGLH